MCRMQRLVLANLTLHRKETEKVGGGTRMNVQPATPNTMPYSRESEMMVLGSMLTSNNNFKIAATTLVEADFHFTEHQVIFNSLQALYRQNKPADIHLVSQESTRQSKSETLNQIAYLTTLAQ